MADEHDEHDSFLTLVLAMWEKTRFLCLNLSTHYFNCRFLVSSPIWYERRSRPSFFEALDRPELLAAATTAQRRG